MAYISNCLTHWVGRTAPSDDERYNILVNAIIARRELLFSPCLWNFHTRFGGVENHRIPMICFTDIPFSEVTVHCDRYSRFGISLAKNYLANCLASPVGYVLNPFAFEGYSFLHHRLHGIRSLIDGKEIPDGKHKGQVFRVNELLAHLQSICCFLENYDKEEYRFNDSQPHPFPEQEKFFDNPSALYYEREWRLVERRGSRWPWDEYRDGRHYFRFEPQFVRYVIMPHSFLTRFAEDSARCMGDYPQPRPSVLAFEDLRYM
jgi:hypothetical protein